MALRPYILVSIRQQSNSADPDRNLAFDFNFVNSGKIENSWQNLTDTAKIKIPRNIYVDDGTGKPFAFGSDPNRVGKNIYGSTENSPLFMRGDRISIILGYFYDNMNGTEELVSTEVFDGYITNIKNRVPIELECEDEMWKLKQIKTASKVWRASEYNVQTMLAEMLEGTNIVVKGGPTGKETTSIGDFRTGGESVAEVLQRLKDDGGLYSYFRGQELRTGGIVYYPFDRNDEVFRFQENIITDKLEYTRKEDINVALKASAEFIEAGLGTNKDGTAKTKRKRLTVTVDQNGVLTDIAADAFDGNLISIPILGVKTIEELTRRAIELLPKFYYTGFRGGFLTMGQPYVRHGDGAIIEDNMLPERNGTYLIKQVVTTFGIGGMRQKVLLHLKINEGFTEDQLNEGL